MGSRISNLGKKLEAMIFRILLLITVLAYVHGSTHPLLVAMRYDPSGSQQPFRDLPLEVTNGSPCNENTLKACTSEFAKDIGLSSSTPFRSRDVVTHLENLYKNKGREGFEKVCQAASVLRMCLSDTVESCMSISNLIQHARLEPTEAAKYVSIAKQLTYQCGPAHDYILSYWQCLNGDYQAEIDQCMAEDVLDSCQYAQNFMTCYTAVMVKHCGKIVARIACETLQRGLVTPVTTGCPSMTCPSNLYSPRHDLSESIKPGYGHRSWPNHRTPVVLRKIHVDGLKPQPSGLIRPPPHHHCCCNFTILSKCSKAFFKNLGLKVPRNATDFVKELGELVDKQGKAGFVKICRAGHTWAHCMGRQRRSCLSVHTLMKMGLSRNDAIIYHTVAQTMGYECGPAYKIFLDKFQCIQTTAVSANATEVHCLQDFQKCIRQHPERKCMYLQKLVNCAIAPFTKACGRELGHALCETERIALRATLPRCHIRCCPHNTPAAIQKIEPAVPSGHYATSNRRPSFLIRKFSVDHMNHESVSVQNIPENACTRATLTRCAGQYFKTLGLKVPKTSQQLMEEFGKFFSKNPGKEGIIKICGATRTFGKCLGGDWRSCFTVPTLMQMGVSKQDAMVYHSMAQTLAYECGPAYQTLVKNYDCIMNATMKAAAVEQKCASDMATCIAQQPDKKCMCLQKFVDCSIPPISNACGPNVGHVLCELDKISSEFLFPTCNVTCTTAAAADVKRKGRNKVISHGLAAVSREHERALDKLHGDESCDEKNFKKCASQLGRELHMHPLPKDPYAFIHKIDEMLKAQGKSGFASLCSAVSHFKSCLGSQVEACISLEHLGNVGIPKQNAILFLALYAQFSDECGPDYITLYDNFECIIRVSHKYNHTIEHCTHDFERFVRHDPEHACHFAQEFVVCLAKPFKDHCSPAVGTALCNGERAALDTVFSHCHLTCSPHVPHSFVPNIHDHGQISAQYNVHRSAMSSTPQTLEEILSSNTCMDTQFNGALRALSRKLSLTEFPKDAQKFFDHLHQWLLNGDLIEKRFNTYCNAVRQFSEDLGGTEESCMSVSYFMKRGLTQSSAIAYVILHKEAKYQCGPAYNVYKENAYCFLHTAEHLKPSLQMCTDTFKEQSKVDPANICTHAQTFADCWTAPFKRHCKSEGALALCQTVKIGLQSILDKCIVSCTPDHSGL